MFQLLNSSGKVVDTSDQTIGRQVIITLAIVAMMIEGCDITITLNGNFYDRVKYRKLMPSCLAGDCD